ncbi:MAG: OmpA family protein [Gammaproteobacteria bacterium]|nr:OmpA family protein [Gammaproteobacteria bacterium]NND36418.1 OmpA family protein [Gammaproteobacteria bacterium]
MDDRIWMQSRDYCERAHKSATRQFPNFDRNTVTRTARKPGGDALNTLQNRRFGISLLATTVACLSALSNAAWAQQDSVLTRAQARREAAISADAALLSPRTLSRAEKTFDDASEDFNEGKQTERVRRKLDEAEQLFASSLENAEFAALTLRNELESRTAAIEADAERLVAEEFAQAEDIFQKAVVALEKGDLNAARQTGDEANEAYRRAELNAIRTEHLAVARSLIAQARAARTDKSAPLTTAKAEALLAQADALLVEDRYAPAPAIELARRAEYEARHAMYIGAVTERVRDQELTTEDVVLEWEAAILAVTDVLAADVNMSLGSAETRDALLGFARELLELRETVAQQNTHIVGLEEEIRELDARLGGAAADRDALIRKVERQARTREQFDQIEEMFAPREAIVIRDGDNIIIRLTGLQFSSNSAAIDASFQPLLDKVDAAVRVFPQCNLTIEGHTDSTGEEARNRQLSEERARAIMSYLTNELKIPAFRIRAAGYGDTRPVASNRTEEGRAQNRRIDVVITPKPDSLY